MASKNKLKQKIQLFPFWALFKWYAKILDFLVLHKTLLENDLIWEAENVLRTTLLKDKKVIHGPFKGMQYPSFTAYGSAIYSKLAGTYEYDISYFFAKAKFKSYKTLIDIGCAEGYYAVGACLINRDVSVYAVDINPEALAFCKKMAVLNCVDDRIELVQNFDWSLIEKSAIQGEALVICDCEGCELTLFIEENSSIWSKFDYIIELHDFINPGTREYLIEKFKTTHVVKIVREKRNRNFLHLSRLTSLQCEIITNEHRPVIMEWMVLEKKG